MPAIPMYLLDKDVEFLNDWINQEEELAFLVSNGEKRWIANREHDMLTEMKTEPLPGLNLMMPDYRKFALWHIPAGPLPLIEAHTGFVEMKFSSEDWDKDPKIDNPWLGWTEQRTGADPSIPYFGPGCKAAIYLVVNLPRDEEIRNSGISWTGNHYKIIGNAASQSTLDFWSKLRRMVRKVATHIPRGNTPGGTKEIYAFPSAYGEIRNGRPCSIS